MVIVESLACRRRSVHECKLPTVPFTYINTSSPPLLEYFLSSQHHFHFSPQHHSHFSFKHHSHVSSQNHSHFYSTSNNSTLRFRAHLPAAFIGPFSSHRTASSQLSNKPAHSSTMASDPQNAAPSASGVSGPAPKAHPYPDSVMPSPDQIFPGRKLATVRPIASVTPFNGNHNILTIDGWTVAAKKNDGFFKEGEYVVYFEVDSFLPATSKFAPLFQKALGQTSVFQDQKGYRVGTRDIVNNQTPIKSAISQGLVFKLGLFPLIHNDFLRRRAALRPTDDFTAIMRNVDYSVDLGVIKWESRPDPDTGNWTMPSFIKRTNTERVQNCPNLFIKPKYRTFVYQESVKLDGRSMTCYFVHRGSHIYPTLHTLGPNYEQNAILPNGRFGVCSKACEVRSLLALFPTKPLMLRADTDTIFSS